MKSNGFHKIILTSKKTLATWTVTALTVAAVGNSSVSHAQQLLQAAKATQTPPTGQTEKSLATALLPVPAHQAIFCGVDAGEGSLEYSLAVSAAITSLLNRKQADTVAGAIDLLKRGLCVKSEPKQ